MIANGNASLHNLLMISMDVLGPQYNYKGLRLALIAILDMVIFFKTMVGCIYINSTKICMKIDLLIIYFWVKLTMALASAGDGAATFMSELGKNGNSHARWNKICDKFESYCNRGGGALIASFIGFILLLIITIMSIAKLLKPNRINHHAP